MAKKMQSCIQVVGYKNTGKTTLVVDLVKAFRQHGLDTATLKHHGHGGKPAEPEATDSTRHLQAGAVAAGVEGEGTFQLSVPDTSIKGILDLYQQLPYDVLLIEGYKMLDFPKVILIKEEKELSLIEQVSNVRLVIVREKQWQEKVNLPVCTFEEKEKYIDFIIKMAKGGKR